MNHKNRSGTNWLDVIERVGNKLPDPIAIFVIAMLAVYVLSALLSPVAFSAIHPGTGEPIRIVSQLTLSAIVKNVTNMVSEFVRFPPLGLVLVALLGVSVAEKAGLIGALVRGLLSMTPRRLLTPMILFVAIISHSAGDAGFVLVVPLGGVIFQSAGRSPLAGIAIAFAGVSAGFSANFLPSALDALLQGFTQASARIIDPNAHVNPLCNWGFMSASSILVILVGWLVGERWVIPRAVEIPQTSSENAETLQGLSPLEKSALFWSGMSVIMLTVLIAWAAWRQDSPLRAPDGTLTGPQAPLLNAMVPLLFFYFVIPGIVYGWKSGSLQGHRDVIAGMTASMESMAYYMVMAFFAAQFTASFRDSQMGALLSVEGARTLASLQAHPLVLLLGVVLLAGFIDLFIGSASAKWAVMAPVLVPMLMPLGIGPEWTQAAFRIGDSSCNVMTPLLPYFPLVLSYCQRYSPQLGVGTLIALMMPFTVWFMVTWSVLLCVFWLAGWPLGIT